MEDEEDELVFEGGDLTWGVVAAAAMGVDEPTYDIRAKAKGKKPVTCASKQVEKRKGPKGKGKGVGQSSSSFRLRDEEEIEFDLEGQDEEEEFNEDS
ncbi:hypothetical protein ACS0TY_002849 [Phlomoides rotata]